MALPVPETKNRDHNYRPNTPLNLGKITSRTHFCHSKVSFWPFYLFCKFWSRFQSVKTPKTKSVILVSKESSNQKMPENKLALEFNFTWESTRLELFYDVLVIYQQCHRALMQRVSRCSNISSTYPRNSLSQSVADVHFSLN